MVKKKLVLVVEDEMRWHSRWKKELSKKVAIKEVFTTEGAEEALNRNPSPDVIVMDACLRNPITGCDTKTFSLVRKIRDQFNYKGPIIAASGSESYRKDLIRMGCDYESPKECVPQKVLEILNF